MSPEQARGDALDARTDAWALGAVLYEMLTGRQLFAGAHPFAVLAAVAAQPIDLTLLPAAVPDSIRGLLARLLDRERRTRERDLTAVASLLLAERDAAGARARPETAGGITASPAPPRRLSILVLPFANRSPDADNEYFSDGLTEEVIADLSGVAALRVVSRTSAMRLKHSDKPLATIATEFGVRYVLEGGVRKSGRDVRITVQLVDTDDDATIWSNKYGGTLDDVFAMQERVARDVVGALAVTLSPPEERKLDAPSRPNGFAYDTYLRTRRDIWSFMPDRLERARAELTHALGVCGDDVWLHTGLGLVHWQYINGGLSGDRRHLDDARGHAERVLALAPHSARGPQLLGLIAGQSGDIVNWIRHLERAVAIDPHDPDTTLWLAFAWTFAGHPHRARPLYAQVLAADPLFDYLFWGLGFDAYYDGRYDDALQHYEKGRRLSPDHPGGPMVMAQTLGTMGEVERMARYVDEHAPDPHAHPLHTLTHIFKHALLGHAGEVDRLFTNSLREKLWSDFQYTQMMTQALAAIGRTGDAIEWLTRTIDRGCLNYPFMAERDPLLAHLRGVPAYETQMARLRRMWETLETDVARTPGRT
jgi:TolB-like protein